MIRRGQTSLLFLVLIGLRWTEGIEMHFEQKDGGFFIRAAGKESAEVGQTTEADDGGSLSSKYFTVLPSIQPVSIRVMYGPFSTKQTVPIRLLVPDPLDNYPNGSNVEADMTPPLDLSAHLVTPSVPKDTPILRVLFHAGQTAFGLPLPSQAGPRPRQQAGSGSRRQRTRLCLVAQASRTQGDVVSMSCSPDARDSTCLAELTIPIHWWPEGPTTTDETPIKPTKIPIQVTYSVYEPENGHCSESGFSTTYGVGVGGDQGGKRIQIQPPTPLATVTLTDAVKSHRVVKADASDAVKLLVPQGSLYPHAKFYVPVIVGKHEHQSLVAFIMRARVKSGLRIVGIEPNVDKKWNITTDFNPRRTHATITAVRKFDPRFEEGKSDGEEVFNWILEAAEEAGDDWDGGRVVWILRYVIQPSSDSSWMKKDPFANFGDERHKLTTRLEIQKDDIQAVVPIAKSWEVVNTAVLNAKQVSRPMKIFIVSRAGQVADVTLQASCKSLDESVLKVSSSCTSVYVDGSEIRGSTNATIVIKYGTYEGSANFIVWMPDFPLDIQLSDSKLNQVKGWRVPNGQPNNGGSGKREEVKLQPEVATEEGKKEDESLLEDEEIDDEDDVDEDEPQQPWDPDEEDNELEGEDKSHCKLRYQHTRLDVYGRFLASDHESGRTSYFISRKTSLKVTDLISDYLRVVDSQVAVLKPNNGIQGVGPGKTEVQVVSPITGRVHGTKEIRVANEKVTITSMKVQVISGVQLSLFPDTDSDNEFVAETSITSKLSAKYQEALLDIKLRFSDNTWIKLDEIDRENYVLAVNSLEPTVVELPPIQNSKYPRIIAVSEGAGPIMRVSLELSDQCHRQNSQPLAMSVAHVEVNFTSGTGRSEFTQNDSHQSVSLGTSKHSFRKRKEGKKAEAPASGDITGIPLKDDSSKGGHSTAHLGPAAVGFGPDKGWKLAAHNTPLEIAMYVLLGVFSVAILVFVASCVVYASRVKKREGRGDELKMDLQGNHLRGASTNAHDWVWLGRASLALHPSLDSGKKTMEQPLRIITNPQCDSLPARPPPRPPKPPHVSPPESVSCGEKGEEYRPPVPPHRNLSPASTKKDQALADKEPTRRDNEKRANVVGNPLMHFIDEEEEFEDEQPALLNHHRCTAKENVRLDMDYDQLMEYFDSLKETEA